MTLLLTHYPLSACKDGGYRVNKVYCKVDEDDYRVFSHDVTVAILVSQNNETAAMLVSKPILWELNSFLMQTLSFVPINLHR